MWRDVTTNDPFRRGAVWRGVVGCVVAYALVITALLSSVLQVEWGAQAALAGAHCMTVGADTGPPAPAGQAHDGSHCPLCTLAAGPAVLPVVPSIASNVVAVADSLVPRGEFERIPARGHPARLPRGPPVSAV